VRHYADEMWLGVFLFAADFTGICFLNRHSGKKGFGNFV
jgi:hypothetical protein